MKLISFRISGAFAAFRDPSVTSNQLVYYIPSKSAVVGILGAMIGIERPATLEELYSDEYRAFFKGVRIGLQMTSKPQKTTFFTNHRSLKEAKTKPFKTELVDRPEYLMYVQATGDLSKRISEALENHKFAYTPYLGHAYCPATITDVELVDAHKTNPERKNTRCVMLDESEAYSPDFNFAVQKSTDGGSVIIERHTHNFFTNGAFDGRVLKHWIPVNGSVFRIARCSPPTLSEYYEVGDYVVCMY